MEDIHRNALRRNWVYLSENLHTTELLDHMLAESVLTQDMYEEIKAQTTRKDKVTQFLFTLQRRGPQAFDKFIAGLHATQQEFIADKLIQTVRELAVMDQPQQLMPQPMQT